MKKTTWLLIVIFIGLPLALLVIYGFMPAARPPMEEFFGGLAQSGGVLFTGFSEQFMQLPYWVAIFGGICFLSAIIIDRWAWGIVLGWRKKLVGDAISDTGLRPNAPYQGGPEYSTSNPPTLQPATTATPLPQLKETE